MRIIRAARVRAAGCISRRGMAAAAAPNRRARRRNAGCSRRRGSPVVAKLAVHVPSLSLEGRFVILLDAVHLAALNLLPHPMIHPGRALAAFRFPAGIAARLAVLAAVAVVAAAALVAAAVAAVRFLRHFEERCRLQQSTLVHARRRGGGESPRKK